MSDGKPSGIVSYLFTDVEGSTAMWEADPAAMSASLAEHDRILRGAIDAHSGHIFSTSGDAFAAGFLSAAVANHDGADCLQAGHDAAQRHLGGSQPG